MRVYIFAICFYMTYLYYKYVINPIRLFILNNFADCCIYHYNKYIDIDAYDADDEKYKHYENEKYFYDELKKIKCGKHQIYITNAVLLNDSSKYQQNNITNKTILLAKIENRLNINDIIRYLSDPCKIRTHLYIEYVNCKGRFIRKKINIIEKRDVYNSNKKLEFGNICT